MALRLQPPAPKWQKLAHRKPYTYTRLRDLRAGDETANMMGVICLFKPPYKSRGADYTCTIEIVDEGTPTSPFPCIFFNRDINKLPKSCNVGDVLCVRRVEVTEFNQRLQGKCRRYCSWHWWKGEGEGRPPVMSCDGSSWDSTEIKRAAELISWNASRQCDSQLSGSLTQTLPSPRMSALRPIASLSLADRKVDLVGVIKTSSTPQKSKGPDYFTTATLIDETSQSEGLPVTFFNPVESHLPQLGPAGCVAYVQNVSLSEYEESLHASGHERSRVVCFSKGPSGEVVSSSRDKVTSEEMQRVEALLEWVAVAQPLAEVAEDSTESPSHTSPPPSHPSLPPTTSLSPPLFLTLTFHPTWRLSSLETIKSCEKVPSLFRVRVKVLQVLHPLQQCCQLRCSQCKYRFSENYKSSDNCPRCTEKRMGQADVPKLRFMFCFSLLVSDSTGQMCLHLSDTNADEFFQNLQPANLTDSSPTRESLLEIFRSLTGSYDPFLPIPSDSSPSSSSFRPWVDCCIQTYPSRKGKQFRVVDTWYVGQAM